MEKTRITTLEEHQALLKRVFDTAKSRVLVVSPFISDTAIKHDNITGMVSKAVSRGVAVELFIDDALNCTPEGFLKASAHNGIVSMLKSGAKVTVLPGIHHKTLIRDNDLITDGSFNWLSAVRQKGRDMQREERTVVQTGPSVGQLVQDEVNIIKEKYQNEVRMKKNMDNKKAISKILNTPFKTNLAVLAGLLLSTGGYTSILYIKGWTSEAYLWLLAVLVTATCVSLYIAHDQLTSKNSNQINTDELDVVSSPVFSYMPFNTWHRYKEDQ